MVSRSVPVPSCVINKERVNNSNTDGGSRRGVYTTVINYYYVNNVINNNTKHNTTLHPTLSEWLHPLIPLTLWHRLFSSLRGGSHD